MNGPFLLLRATVAFATVGANVLTRILGARRGRVALIGGMGVSTIVAIYLQVTH